MIKRMIRIVIVVFGRANRSYALLFILNSCASANGPVHVAILDRKTKSNSME